MSVSTSKLTWKQIFFLIILLLISSAAIMAAVIYMPAVTTSIGDLEAGNVATQDILAPSAISYTSEVLTEQQRQTAINSVAIRYTQADTYIARQQLEHLRAALAYITSVRADVYSSDEQKLTDLAALQDINISQETALGILELSESRWVAVQQEAVIVLEQVMRNTIRESFVDNIRASVPNLVSLSFPEDQALIIAEIVSAFIAPNSFFSENLTETARQEAGEAVEAVVVSFAAGEVVVQRGEIITEEDIEALRKMGLAQPERSWQEFASAGIWAFLSVGVAIIYLRRNPRHATNTRGILVVVILFIIFLALARLTIPAHPLVPYLFPLSAYALIVASLYSEELALISIIPLIILTTYGHNNISELILFYGVSSMFGVLIPKREQRISSYIWVGITIAATGAATITAFQLIQSELDIMALASQSATIFLSGLIAAGLAILIQYILAPILGQITPLQLLELSRPDNPLLEYLLRYAPGTYQHSLQVANLAEQAAERIDAESLLTRVGALYHDIGKAKNPFFFIENQIPGQINTHEDLEPADSAAVIIKHVTDGLDLADEHRLPNRIKGFIAEHHGTLMTKYQWTQAVNAANGDDTLLDENMFTYPGPRPQSRETALVMLADGCEARVRAQKPESEEDLREMIEDTIDNRLAHHQLDDTSFTLRELRVIKDSFVASLRGIYHPRVDYPTLNYHTQNSPSKSAK
jgi:cyclic-di-AMP phosphodiesterase PgpH